MNNEAPKRIFMLGIAGSGMRGLAHLLASQGHTIVGTDDAFTDGAIDPSISSAFKIVSPSDAESALANTTLLIHTDAAPATHPLRQKAEELGIQQQPYHTALGEFSRSYTTIAVTGTHGKSSTTSFLAHILITCGADPTVLIGAPVQGWELGNARVGKSNVLVVEADEYRRHFLELSPSHIIVTSIDFDHPDYFTSLSDVESAYSEFLQSVKTNGVVFTHASVQEAHPNVTWPSQTVALTTQDLESMPAPIPGTHMQANAALAVAAAEKVAGIPRDDATKALQSFPGLGRRLESLGMYNDVLVYSDYAHHPAEISATVKAVKEKHQNARVSVIFEAHMIERLSTFFHEYVESLKLAGTVLIYPPFSPSGRETDSSENALVTKLDESLQAAGITTLRVDTPETLMGVLKQAASNTDVFLATTAGKLDGALRKGLKS